MNNKETRISAYSRVLSSLFVKKVYISTEPCVFRDHYYTIHSDHTNGSSRYSVCLHTHGDLYEFTKEHTRRIFPF